MAVVQKYRALSRNVWDFGGHGPRQLYVCYCVGQWIPGLQGVYKRQTCAMHASYIFCFCFVLFNVIYNLTLNVENHNMRVFNHERKFESLFPLTFKYILTFRKV